MVPFFQWTDFFLYGGFTHVGGLSTHMQSSTPTVPGMVAPPKPLLSLTPAEEKSLAIGQAFLQGGNFMRAHEAFEDAWRAAEGPQRTLFHALAQLAASYHQLMLGRARASVRTWHKARAKLASLGLLTDDFASQVAALHARLGIDEQGPRFLEPARLSGQRFPLLTRALVERRER